MGRRTWDFRVERERVANALVVSLAGRLSAAAVHLLDDALTAPEHIAVVVDLAALDYISGPGVASLEAAARRATREGRAFVLCGVQQPVLTCFDLAGLLPALAVEADRRSALVKVAGR